MLYESFTRALYGGTVLIMEGLRTHEITPAYGTVRRLDGSQGSVLEPRHYPLTARCMECGRGVQIDAYMFADWYHLSGDPEENVCA